VLGIAITGAYFYVGSSVEELSGNAVVPGLRAPVHVWVDSLGIPQLFAASRHDVFFAQGYVHASDRLWQMELFRRVADGRLAEIFGKKALAADRLLRTLDLGGAAARQLAALSTPELDCLQAYTDGVNARIRSWQGALPPEFVLLHLRPKPWDLRASLAIGVVMNLDLSHWRNDLSRFQAESVLPPAKLAYLKLPYPSWGPSILDQSVPVPPLPTAARRRRSHGVADRPGERATSGASALVSEPAERTPAVPASLADLGRKPRHSSASPWNDPLRLLASFSIREASNAWVIAGSHTASGHPILANDMHLGLRAPAIWYLVGLHASEAGLAVAGLSLPGVPGVVVGYNRSVAWGFTNGMVDDMDFVVEAVNLDHSAYRDASGWRDFHVRVESVAVRGEKEPVVMRIRETVRGPVISDAVPGLGATLSAVWVAARPVSAVRALLAMNEAEDADSFERALQDFGAPHQNVVFATVAGHIGYRLAGTVPLRATGDGSVPISFERFGTDWPGFWPLASMPAGRDPERGFFATANNLQAPGLDGVVSADYPLPFRARRLTDRLRADSGWSVASTMRLQRDTRSLFAARVVDRAIAAARGIGANEAAVLLARWNQDVRLESRAAPLFYAWLYRLRVLLAADEFAAVPGPGFFPAGALLRSVEEGDASPWVDDVRTDTLETFAGLSERAMRDAIRVVAGRRWGEVHAERNVHLLGRVRLLEALFHFNVGPYPSPGGPYTLRPDDYSRWLSLGPGSWTPPWVSEYGPSERFVAELDPAGNRGLFLLPTGQSGNPLSSHYRDMNPRWRSGRPVPVPLAPEKIERRSVAELWLRPVAAGGL